jgi:GNAT superfamily N-acetyltransferase
VNSQPTPWRVDLVSRPEASVVELLESVEFGSAGLRYRRKAMASALERLAPSEYLTIREQGNLIAAYTLTPTQVSLANEKLPAVYRGLLAVAPTHRRQGIGRKLVETALEHIRDATADKPTFCFGLIESRNEASLKLLEDQGGKNIGSLESRLIYRQWPRPSSLLRQLDGSLANAYAESLERQHSGSALVIQAAAGLPLFGLVDGSQLRAAARVGAATLDLGPGGWFARFLHRHAYGRFEALGKRYNRRAFRYLTIHDPLVTDSLGAFRDFTEALLARYDAHMALFTLDPLSETAGRLAAAGLLGSFSRTTRQELIIMAHGLGIPEERLERARSGPATGGPVY